MGRANVSELIEVGGRAALRWHLESNHYPPVPHAMLPVCQRVIELAADGQWHELVTLPDDILFRGGEDATVAEVVSALHLEPFVDHAVSEFE